MELMPKNDRSPFASQFGELTLIEVKQLTRVDPSTQQTVLHSVNLTLKERDRVGLGGPSGSGKSSLLRAIACLDPYQSGSLRFRGETLTPEEIPSYRSRVVYLPQRAVIFEGTVKENLVIPFPCGVVKRYMMRKSLFSS